MTHEYEQEDVQVYYLAGTLFTTPVLHIKVLKVHLVDPRLNTFYGHLSTGGGHSKGISKLLGELHTAHLLLMLTFRMPQRISSVESLLCYEEASTILLLIDVRNSFKYQNNHNEKSGQNDGQP